MHASLRISRALGKAGRWKRKRKRKREDTGSSLWEQGNRIHKRKPPMREKAKASLVHGQRTSSRWWLVSVHLIWPRLSAIISFHAATLASGTRKASSVSDLWDRWFRSIGQAHRNFDPSLQHFSFDSFFLFFFLASVFIFLILPNSRWSFSLYSTIWNINNLWTQLYSILNLFRHL